MSVLDGDFSDDLFYLLCGEVVGRGQYRTVYTSHLNPEWVIKKDSGGNFSNISEWQLYDELRETKLGKWLAPVHWVSPRGLWLIQARTEPIQKKQIPKKVPALFADLKPGNWGMLDGKPVCHDYGNNYLYVLARKHGGKLRKAYFS
jgi:hypothetical protein